MFRAIFSKLIRCIWDPGHHRRIGTKKINDVLVWLSEYYPVQELKKKIERFIHGYTKGPFTCMHNNYKMHECNIGSNIGNVVIIRVLMKLGTNTVCMCKCIKTKSLGTYALKLS